jgi:hypothetical protein
MLINLVKNFALYLTQIFKDLWQKTAKNEEKEK